MRRAAPRTVRTASAEEATEEQPEAAAVSAEVSVWVAEASGVAVSATLASAVSLASGVMGEEVADSGSETLSGRVSDSCGAEEDSSESS